MGQIQALNRNVNETDEKYHQKSRENKQSGWKCEQNIRKIHQRKRYFGKIINKN